LLREATIHQSPKGDLAIRQGSWKLIFFKNGEQELYNLQNDLSEKINVAAANSEVVEWLTVLMRRYIAEGRSTTGPLLQNDVPVEISKKKAGQ
jgi:hypothetical protein